MPQRKYTRYLHVCTNCGLERYTAHKQNPSGLCRSCTASRLRWRLLHFAPGALYSNEDIIRFWQNVDKDTPCACHGIDDRCWLYMLGRPQDYGTISIKDIHGKRHTVNTHRFAYQADHGKLPQEIFVLHRPPCLLRHCIRHLYAGTYLENAQDAILMNRQTRGETNGYATMTNEGVRAIRADRVAGMTLDAIAKKYNRSISNVWDIVQRNTWKHIL